MNPHNPSEQNPVIPAKAGIQQDENAFCFNPLDSGLRQNDGDNGHSGMNERPPLPTYTSEVLATLTPEKLIDIIIEDEDRTPRNVIDECAARGDAMTEYLQQLHDDEFIWRLDDELDDDGVWWLRLHAVMILGLIPSERAGLLLVDLMRRMSQEEDDDVQGWLAGYWPAQFKNKPESVLPALRELGMDANLDWYIRIQAIDAFVARTAQQGDEACKQALAWLAGIVADENEDWTLRLSAGDSLLDYAPPEYRELLEDMAKRQGFMGVHFCLDDVQKAYADTRLVPEWMLTRFQNPWGFYEEIAITQRQIRWEEERTRSSEDDDEDDFDDFDFPEFDNSEPYIRTEPKIGRNEPCPCGSGKKYKKCCLAKE